MTVSPNDPFGSAKDDKNVKFPAQFVNKFHSASDLDTGPHSQHHSLGPKANQASPGNHIHDGKTSRLIGDGMLLNVLTSSGTADQKIDRLINELKKVMNITTS